MPPWPEWQFEYVGSRFLGRLLGLGSSLCVSLIRKLFGLTLAIIKGPRSAQGFPKAGTASCNGPRPELSSLGRPSKMAISTSVTLLAWMAITWKPIWSAAGPTGDKILTVVLLLVSGAWPISLVWIWFSQSKAKKSSLLTTDGTYAMSGSEVSSRQSRTGWRHTPN
jgi:hypothetical protein